MDKATLNQINSSPVIDDLKNYRPVFWENPDYGKEDPDPMFSQADIFDAVARWERFAPYLAIAFPETAQMHGVIESPLTKVDTMKKAWSKYNGLDLPGNLYVKQDNALPISGSIKSRGGIYEVLKFAEHVAMKESNLTYMDDYSVLATPRYKKIFANYGVTAGSTGNLGLSIGIAAATFGFKTTIHMSHDARQWKKDLLRKHGVNVVEHDGDCNFAVGAARKQAEGDDHTYFIDDEGSKDLFLGYSVAGVRLQKQLKDQNIPVDEDHPIFVYLPAGVGGSPGGVTFGLKKIIGKNIHGIFAEPCHIPSVVLGMSTKLYHNVSVFDIGLDGKTQADGLAVGRSSVIAGPVMRTLLRGIGTFSDNEIMKYVAMLDKSEKIDVEPSATAGFAIMKESIEALKDQYNMKNATHIIWSTGGDMVPKSDMDAYIKDGNDLLNK